MKINYFSDLHLEFGRLAPPDNDADIIVAAGDIGPGLMGMQWLLALDKPVIYIAGNHEYYGTDLADHLATMRQICKGSNVFFLENNSVIVGGVRFLGCTLWTDLFRQGVEPAQQIHGLLNDFRKIKLNAEALTPEHTQQMHQDSKTWLGEKLSFPFLGKTVVVTHHAPSSWSWDGEEGELRQLAYCNDLPGLQQPDAADLWIHGHIHTVKEYELVGGKVVCNPRGYVGLKLTDSFDVNRTIEI